MTDQIISLSGGVQATKVGLVFNNGLLFDEWQDIGTRLGKIEGAVHWWIGDWLNYGESKYGETYAQAMDETGFDYGTLADDKWIANQYQISERSENLLGET